MGPKVPASPTALGTRARPPHGAAAWVSEGSRGPCPPGRGGTCPPPVLQQAAHLAALPRDQSDTFSSGPAAPLTRPLQQAQPAGGLGAGGGQARGRAGSTPRPPEPLPQPRGGGVTSGADTARGTGLPPTPRRTAATWPSVLCLSRGCFATVWRLPLLTFRQHPSRLAFRQSGALPARLRCLPYGTVSRGPGRWRQFPGGGARSVPWMSGSSLATR